MLVHVVCVVEEEEEHGAATDVVTLGNLVNRACGTQFDVLHVWDATAYFKPRYNTTWSDRQLHFTSREVTSWLCKFEMGQ